VSGQGPNLQTQADCPVFDDFLQVGTGADGQALGTGCVYPPSVPTVGGELEQAGLSWRAYEEDMGNDPAREAAACAHPSLGAIDNTQTATATDGYATRHDPFVYFHSIIDDPAACAAHVVPLSRLPADLQSAAATPSYSFITPSLCDDGHDATCADGTPGGLPRADAFLRSWVPRILASPAFRADGLLVVTFDESAGNGAGDDTACCAEPLSPDTFANGVGGPGGGRVGAVALSPFIAPRTVSSVAYDHYSLLRTVEGLFSLPLLGEAGAPGLAAFGPDVFSAAASPAPPPPAVPSTACSMGALVAGVAVEHRRRGSLLRLIARRPLRLTVTVLDHGAPRRIGRALGCGRHTIALGVRHGRLRLLARAGTRAERLERRF
jgi:phosphatidylinositol-3-phosphatase